MKEQFEILAAQLSLRQQESVEREQEHRRAIEQIRQELVRRAQIIVNEYEAYRQEKASQVAQAIEETIQPWFGALLESGLYAHIQRLQTRRQKIVLNDPISYYSPKDLETYLHPKTRSDSRSRNVHAFAGVATTVYAKQIPLSLSVDEVFVRAGYGVSFSQEAYIALDTQSMFSTTGIFDPREGVTIAQLPSGEIDLAALATEFTLPKHRLEYRDRGLAVPTVSPVIFTEFAAQIQSGRVNERLEEALQGR